MSQLPPGFVLDGPGQGGPVYGPPPKAPAPPTPLQIRDQQLQEEAAARSAGADARAAEAAARAAAEWNATHEQDGTPKPKPSDIKPTEFQSKSAGFYGRMLAADRAFNHVPEGSRDARTVAGQTFHEWAPSVENSLPVWLGGNSPDRQLADNNALDFIRASLRQESGASINADEEIKQYRIYFPMPGDSPDVIKQKAEKRKQAIEGFRIAAGPEAAKIDASMAEPAPDTGKVAGTQDNQNAAYDENGNYLGLTGSVTDTSRAGPGDGPPPGGGDPLSLDTIALGLKQGAGSVVQGVGDTIGIVANPIGQMLYNATGYGDHQYDAGTALRNAFGLPQNPNPTSDAMIRAGTGGMVFGGAARSLADLANPGVWQNGLRVVGASPVTDAAAGAAGGFGADQARQAGYGPGVQTLAALALGAPVAGVSAIANRAPRVPTPYAAAAERQGVQMMPADAGGPMTRRITGGLAQSPVSAGPIVEAAQANQGQIAAAARRASNGQAATATTDVAGENVRAAGQRYSQQTSTRGGRLYDRAERAAQGVHIVPQNTIASIDQQIARLSENEGSNAALIRELQTLRSDLASGASVAGMRDLRTNLRGNTAPGGALRSNQQQAMYRGIVDQLSSDIEAGLNQAGRGGAAAAFRRADDFWRQRVEQIDQVLQPILGRDGQKSGEQIIQSIEGMTRGQNGGNRRLGRLMGNMTPDEQSNVRATVIDRLGRATPGQQTAEGEAFSAATFLTNWNRMTPQAKATMFGNGDLRRNLDDIATLSQGSRDAGRYANHSNTSGGNIVTGAAYLLGTGVGGLKTAATIAALQYSSARLLASPRYARWLARMPATQNARALNAYIGRLGTIAAEDALIASDARGLQQRLQQSLSQSPVSAAANEKEQN